MRCFQCKNPIIASDDEAGICIRCGGRNRRSVSLFGSWQAMRDIDDYNIVEGTIIVVKGFENPIFQEKERILIEIGPATKKWVDSDILIHFEMLL